jgi:hypothetical protein
MKTTLFTALLACAAACPAVAQEPALFEPGLRLSWKFGAAAYEGPPTLSLGLYPNAVGWQRLWSDLGARELSRVVERPAVIELRWSESTDLRLMGVSHPLAFGAHASNAAEDGAGSSWGWWLLGGAAVAVIAIAASSGDDGDDNGTPEECPQILDQCVP